MAMALCEYYMLLYVAFWSEPLTYGCNYICLFGRYYKLSHQEKSESESEGRITLSSASESLFAGHWPIRNVEGIL